MQLHLLESDAGKLAYRPANGAFLGNAKKTPNSSDSSPSDLECLSMVISELCRNLVLKKLMSLSEVLLANLSQTPARGVALATTGTYTQASLIPLGTLDPDGCSWSKFQQSLALSESEGGLLAPHRLGLISGDWPRSATWDATTVFRLPPLVRLIDETESGLLPTPLATLATHGGPNQRDSNGRPGLQMAAMMTDYQRPIPSEIKGSNAYWQRMEEHEKAHGITSEMLSEGVMWQTPVADDAVNRAKGKYNSRGASKNSGDGIATFAKQYPTPNASGGFRSDGELAILARNLENREEFEAMSDRACESKKKKAWPTPTAHNAKETNAKSEQNRNTPTLASQIGGKLNPTWVEWLMGLPIGWTDSKAWEMASSRKSHSSSAKRSTPSKNPKCE